MASSPSSRRAFYNHNNKDYPGCMGGLMQLFDLNQALAGRKLLTDKKCSGALGAPRSSLDVGGSISEVLKPDVEKSEEVPKWSGPRKLNGMPIKALISQELSKESDNKNRSPSVVARLMGLDALPADYKLLQKPLSRSLISKVDEKFAERSVVDRQRHEEITPHNVRLYAKKAKAPILSRQKDIDPQHCESRAGSSGSEAIFVRKHPQEQQLQEFKKEFEAWQSQKSWGHSNRSSRFDDIQAPMPSEGGLQHGKWFSTKRPRESLAAAKQNALHDRLHESREFQDALEFLQSNKEFFLRFLHEPNSVFARHLQANESDSLSPPQMTEGMKIRVPGRVPDASQGSSRPHFWVKDSPLSSQYHKNAARGERRPPSWATDFSLSRSPKGETKVERGFLSMPHSPLATNSEDALGLQGRCRHAFSPMAPENKLNNANCHIPTRIVVLKPSPGKIRNSKSVSPVYCRSPRDQKANDDFQEVGTDVFERLREKLRKDTGGEYKRESKSAGFIINERYRVVSKDPREIAREIARQVRENISKDLMFDPGCLSTVPSMTNLGGIPMLATDSQDCDVDACGLTNYLYYHPRSMSPSLHPDTSLDLEALCESKDNKERVPGQVTTECTKESGETMLRGLAFISKNDILLGGSDEQFLSGQKVLHTLKGSGEFGLSTSHDGSYCHKPTGQVENSKRIVSDDPLVRHESVEENKAELSRGSLRSEVANLAFPGYENGGLQNMVELQVYGGNTLKDGPCEDGSVTISHDDMIADLTGPADETLHAKSAPESRCGTEFMDTSGNLCVEEVKQTVVGMEDLVGSHTVEKVAVVKEGKLLQRNGECSVLDSVFLHDACMKDTVNIYSLPSQDHQILLHMHGKDVERAVDFTGQECESPYSCNAQTMEALSPSNDARVHPPFNVVTASPPFMSLPSSNPSVDYTPDPVKEQIEQPSPVSILDPPFQEELVVPPEFKELSSDLEELQVHLCLLNSSSGDNALNNDDPKIKNVKSESDIDASVYSRKICVAGRGHSEHSDTDESDAMGKSSHHVSDNGDVSELLYVKNILVTSGFTEVGFTLLTQWYAPGQPLNPCLFQEIERSSFDQEKDFAEGNQSNLKVCKQGKEIFSASRRRLLFDRADEALSKVLGPHFNCRLWLTLPNPLLCVPTGQDLAKIVWSSVWCSLCSHSGMQETLENLVTKDLHEDDDWRNVDTEIEAAGLDVERAILNDLIEEALLVL